MKLTEKRIHFINENEYVVPVGVIAYEKMPDGTLVILENFGDKSRKEIVEIIKNDSRFGIVKFNRDTLSEAIRTSGVIDGIIKKKPTNWYPTLGKTVNGNCVVWKHDYRKYPKGTKPCTDPNCPCGIEPQPLENFGKGNGLFDLNNQCKKCHAKDNNRQLLEKLLPHDLEKEGWKEILKTFDNKCPITGETKKVNKEHFLPVIIGHGGYTFLNVSPLVKRLNVSKGAKNPFEWEKTLPPASAQLYHNDVICYFAKLHKDAYGFDYATFEKYVYWCFENPRTPEQVKVDNEKGLTSVDLFLQHLTN